MFVEDVLNESYGYDDYEYDIEPTNEGYDSMATVMMEDIVETRKLNLALEAVDYLVLKEAIENQDSLNEGVGEIAGKIKEHVKSVISKIRELISKMWSKIKEVFNSIKLKVFSHTSVDKFVILAKKELSGLSNFSGVEYDGFEFDTNIGSKVISKIDQASGSYIKKCIGEYKNASKKASQNYDAEKSNESINKDIIKAVADVAKVDKFKSTVVKQAIGVEPDKITETVYKKLRGGTNVKKPLKISSPSDALHYLEGYKALMSEINELEKSTNTAYSNSLKELDAIEASITPTSNALTAVVQNIAKLSKSRDEIVNTIIHLTLAAAKECKLQATSIVNKCLAQGRKNKKSDSTKSVNADTDLLSSIMDRI